MRELSFGRFMRHTRINRPVAYDTRRCKELLLVLNYDVHGDIKEAERCVLFTWSTPSDKVPHNYGFVNCLLSVPLHLLTIPATLCLAAKASEGTIKK